MYKLIHFKATNFSGFMSGLGKKTFEIDLSAFQDKEVMCIVGGNGKGKSTFQSFIHPWHTPSDRRPKFVIAGKEGTLVREYQGDDGTVLLSKCIYSPRADGSGHNTKCFLKLTRADGDEIELNPNGNVKSYEALLYTYFGINRDYINFASYNDAVSGIVKMTDTERKNNVGSLIPNTGRFEVAYNIINDKYRDLRNLIRNVTQKILSLRDEDALRSDLKRVTAELTRYTSERESAMNKLAKSQGRLKELTKGEDLKDLIEQYNEMVNTLLVVDSRIDKIYNRLMKLYDKLDIENDQDSISFKGIENVQSKVLSFERKVASAMASEEAYQRQVDHLRAELSKVEKELSESESVLYSLQTQDIDELLVTRKNYVDQISGLRYAKVADEYADMSYDEVVNFSKTVAMIDSMIRAMFEEYGQLVSDYLENADTAKFESLAVSKIDTLRITIVTNSARKDRLYREMIEKEQYRKFQNILDQRPATCTIDTCPFISSALKWSTISEDIASIKAQYEEVNMTINDDQAQVDFHEKTINMHNDILKLIDYIKNHMDLISKYFKADIDDVMKSIQTGMWSSLMDIMKLKDIAAILSEKDLYIKITTQMIPEIDHLIEIAKMYGTNRDLVITQINRLKDNRTLIKGEISEVKMHHHIYDEMILIYRSRLELWKETSELIQEYKTLISDKLSTHTLAETKGSEIQKIKELKDRCVEQEILIRDLDDILKDRIPVREQLRMDLLSLDQLKTEKVIIERDFIIVDIMRTINQPGKGMRKELINIYMYDIYQIANQLLLNTFDGNLYLGEFIINDKEFIIPYVYNGTEGDDISTASSSQQSTIATAISLAIISKLIDKYGIITYDEVDAALSEDNKANFVDVFTKQSKYVGINQAFIITQTPEYYEPYDCGFIVFPGGKINSKSLDVITIK